MEINRRSVQAPCVSKNGVLSLFAVSLCDRAYFKRQLDVSRSNLDFAASKDE